MHKMKNENVVLCVNMSEEEKNNTKLLRGELKWIMHSVGVNFSFRMLSI